HDRPVAHQSADHQRPAARDYRIEVERVRISRVLFDGRGAWRRRCRGAHSDSASVARTAAKNARDLASSLIPGAASTPLATSTAHGRTSRIARATLSAFRPPARMTGRSKL